jgi:hypothetical protein
VCLPQHQLSLNSAHLELTGILPKPMQAQDCQALGLGRLVTRTSQVGWHLLLLMPDTIQGLKNIPVYADTCTIGRHIMR